MYCSVCGTKNASEATFCSKCGTILKGNNYQHYDPQPSQTDPGKEMGIISFVLSIASFFIPTTFILPAVGAVLGYLARDKSQKAGFKNDLATAGMVISIVQAVLWALACILSIIFIIIYFVFIVFVYGLSFAMIGGMYY